MKGVTRSKYCNSSSVGGASLGPNLKKMKFSVGGAPLLRPLSKKKNQAKCSLQTHPPCLSLTSHRVSSFYYYYYTDVPHLNCNESSSNVCSSDSLTSARGPRSRAEKMKMNVTLFCIILVRRELCG